MRLIKIFNRFYEGFGIFLMLVGQGVVITGGDLFIGSIIMFGGLIFYVYKFAESQEK